MIEIFHAFFSQFLNGNQTDILSFGQRRIPQGHVNGVKIVKKNENPYLTDFFFLNFKSNFRVCQAMRLDNFFKNRYSLIYTEGIFKKFRFLNEIIQIR